MYEPDLKEWNQKINPFSESFLLISIFKFFNLTGTTFLLSYTRRLRSGKGGGGVEEKWKGAVCK